MIGPLARTACLSPRCVGSDGAIAVVVNRYHQVHCQRLLGRFAFLIHHIHRKRKRITHFVEGNSSQCTLVCFLYILRVTVERRSVAIDVELVCATTQPNALILVFVGHPIKRIVFGKHVPVCHIQAIGRLNFRFARQDRV